MKYNKKTKIIFAVVLALNFILAGLYVYAFYEAKEKNKKVAIASRELEKQLNKEGDIGLVAKTVKETEIQRSKIDTYFIMRDDIVDFTQKVESLGGTSNTELAITGLNTQGNTLSFELESKGSFVDIVHLISLIENLPFKLDINKSYINKVSGDGGNQWNGNFNVTLSGFSDK